METPGSRTVDLEHPYRVLISVQFCRCWEPNPIFLSRGGQIGEICRGNSFCDNLKLPAHPRQVNRTSVLGTATNWNTHDGRFASPQYAYLTFMGLMQRCRTDLSIWSRNYFPKADEMIEVDHSIASSGLMTRSEYPNGFLNAINSVHHT